MSGVGTSAGFGSAGWSRTVATASSVATLGVIAGHRWSAIAHLGALTEPVVRHRCDVRCCVRPDHLAVGTQAQNVADTVRHGRWTSYARTGPRQWPALSYALRDAARAGNDTLLDELLRRAVQLELWPEHDPAEP